MPFKTQANGGDQAIRGAYRPQTVSATPPVLPILITVCR